MFGAWREKCSELGLSQSLSGEVEAEGNIEVQHEGQFRIANVKGDGMATANLGKGSEKS